MSFRQKNPQCSPEKTLQTHGEAQGLEVAQVSKALEETHLSSHPPMPGSSKEAPDASIPSAPESPQSSCSSSIAIRANSPSKSDEGFGNQMEEDSTSLLEPDPNNLPRDVLDLNVGLLVNFLLFKYQKKEFVTKADMLKNIIKEYEGHFSEIFLKASDRLELIFGIDLKEVDPTNHYYGFFIKLGLTYDGMQHGEEDVPKTGLLILVLGVIFMKGNRATEEEVWEVLSFTDIYPGRKHFIFGEPRELITKFFVEEKYLTYQPVGNSDPPQFEFLWGPRARAETTKMQVLEFLAKIHGTDPVTFALQYEEALQGEEEMVHSSVSAGAASPMATASSSTMPSSFHGT